MQRVQARLVLAVVLALCLPPLGVASAAGRAPPRISFISERDGSRDVYLIAADGSGERLIAGGPGDQNNGPSTPDGTQLLVTVGVTGQTPEKLASGQSGVEQERAFHFRLIPLPPGPGSMVRGQKPDALPPLPPRAVLRSPSFSRDGRLLIFESEPQTGDGLRELFSLRLDGPPATALRQLTHNREGNFLPSVCGRSGYVAFTSSRDRTSEIYRMRLDGSDLRRLTYVGGSKRTPRCATAGDQIFFISDHEGADRIYSVHRNGSTPRRLTARDLDPAWVEDELAVADDGIHVAYTLRRPGTAAAVHIVDLRRQRDCGMVLPAPAVAGEPDWSPPLPSGHQLAFTVEQAAQAATADQPTRARTSAAIFTSDALCGGIRRLTTSPGRNWHPLWLRN
jgi:Tol biopolymer transport system component